jgi:phage tail-like protein
MPQLGSATPLVMGHLFAVTIGTINTGTWSKISGLSVKFDLADHRVGQSDQYFAYTGQAKFEKIKVSRALCQDTEQVRTMLNNIQVKGPVQNQTGSITSFSSDQSYKFTVSLQNVFPLTWNISDLDSGGSKVVIETLEIVHAGFFTSARTLPRA